MTATAIDSYSDYDRWLKTVEHRKNNIQQTTTLHLHLNGPKNPQHTSPSIDVIF